MLRIFRAQTKYKKKEKKRDLKKKAFVVSVQAPWPQNHALLKKFKACSGPI